MAVPQFVSFEPTLTQRISISSNFIFNYDDVFDSSTVTIQNIVFEDSNGNPIYFEVVLSGGDTIITITPEEDLSYDTTFDITLTANIKGSSPNTSILQKTIKFITERESEIPQPEISTDGNVNDVFYKNLLIPELLDVETIVKDGEKFDYKFIPTIYNPITKKYEKEGYGKLTFDLHEFLKEKIRNQFLNTFSTFFENINSFNILSDSDFKDLEKSLYTKSFDINTSSGLKSKIEFLIKLYANSLGKYFVDVEEDPIENFIYHISTDMSKDHWQRTLKNLIHLVGWQEKFYEIPNQYITYSSWIASTEYTLGDRISENGFVLEVTNTGTSGTIEPNWRTHIITIGDTIIADGTVNWEAVEKIKTTKFYQTDQYDWTDQYLIGEDDILETGTDGNLIIVSNTFLTNKDLSSYTTDELAGKQLYILYGPNRGYYTIIGNTIVETANSITTSESFKEIEDNIEFKIIEKVESFRSSYEIMGQNRGLYSREIESTLTMSAAIAYSNNTTTYIDETTEANSETEDDVNLLPIANQEENDAYYFGKDVKFDIVKVYIGTEMDANLSFIWEYWDGEQWEELTDIEDESEDFTNLGRHHIKLNIPKTDWFQNIVNLQGPFYYVRVRVNSFVNCTTPPKTHQVWVDGFIYSIQDNYNRGEQFYEFDTLSNWNPAITYTIDDVITESNYVLRALNSGTPTVIQQTRAKPLWRNVLTEEGQTYNDDLITWSLERIYGTTTRDMLNVLNHLRFKNKFVFSFLEASSLGVLQENSRLVFDEDGCLELIVVTGSNSEFPEGDTTFLYDDEDYPVLFITSEFYAFRSPSQFIFGNVVLENLVEEISTWIGETYAIADFSAVVSNLQTVNFSEDIDPIIINDLIIISGSTNPVNDGTFSIVSYDRPGRSVVIENPSGVIEASSPGVAEHRRNFHYYVITVGLPGTFSYDFNLWNGYAIYFDEKKIDYSDYEKINIWNFQYAEYSAIIDYPDDGDGATYTTFVTEINDISNFQKLTTIGIFKSYDFVTTVPTWKDGNRIFEFTDDGGGNATGEGELFGTVEYISNETNKIIVQLFNTKLSAVLLDDGGVVTDQTTEAYNVSANDVELLPSIPVQEDAIYFGRTIKFDTLSFELSQEGVGTWVITWEYYNGSTWETLSGLVDNTISFTALGNKDVSFTLPLDWDTETIDSKEFYYVRARVSSYTSITTQPMASVIFIDRINKDFNEDKYYCNTEILYDTLANTCDQGTTFIKQEMNAAIAYDQNITTYTDETTESNDDTTDDMNLLPVGDVDVDDAYYFGNDYKFNKIAIDISTVGTSDVIWTLAWEYFDGSTWQTLSNITDGTNVFTIFGLSLVIFDLPTDWYKNTVNSQGPFYYVRARVDTFTGTTYTQPKGKLSYTKHEIDFNRKVDLLFNVFDFDNYIWSGIASDGGTVELGDNYLYLDAAIQDDGGVYTDETSEATDFELDYLSLLPAVPVVDDSYYFGHTEQFNTLQLNISTAGVGTWTIIWEYWDGTNWVSLTNVVDGTSGFSAFGIKNIYFTKPEDWVNVKVNAQGSFYYIRARVSVYSAITTQPEARFGYVLNFSNKNLITLFAREEDPAIDYDVILDVKNDTWADVENLNPTIFENL